MLNQHSITGDVSLQGFWIDCSESRISRIAKSKLLVQSVLIEDTLGTRCLIVAADIFGFSERLTGHVKTLARKYGIEAPSVILNASHTHYAPGTIDSILSKMGSKSEEFESHLFETLSLQIEKLAHSLEPIKIEYTESQCQIGFNRRLRKNDRILMQPNEEGYYNKITPIIVLTKQNGERFIVVSHGCHPTSTGQSAKISSDFVGHLRDEVLSKCENTTGVMFLQSASGNLKSGYADETGVPVWSACDGAATLLGAKLAKAVTSSIESGTLPVSGMINASECDVELDFRKDINRNFILKHSESLYYGLSAELVEAWQDEKQHLRSLCLKLNAVEIGNVAICAAPLELPAEIYGKIRSKVYGKLGVIVLGCTNGLFGYLPTDSMCDEGGYEAYRSHMIYKLPAPLKVGSEMRVVEAFVKASARWAQKRLLPERTNDIVESNAFFVLSTGRCGTKTLHATLNLASNARVWHHPEPRLVRETLAAYWGKLDYSEVFLRARGDYIKQANESGLVHGETDHNMTPFCRTISELMPKTKFIVLVRNPYDFIRSGMRRNYYMTNSIWDQGRLRPHHFDPFFKVFDKYTQFEKICWLWAETYRLIIKFLELIDHKRVIVVEMEQLVSDPFKIEQLYDFLSLTGYSKKETDKIIDAKLNSQIHGIFPDSGQWDVEHHELLHKHCGKTMAYFQNHKMHLYR